MSLLGWFTGEDDLQAQSNALDAQRAALNQRAVDTGHWSQAQAEAAAQHQAASDIENGSANVHDSINEAFDEGWKEGQSNVSNFIKGTLNKIVADPLRAVIGGVPWWLWLVLIGFVAWKLGVFSFVWRHGRARFAT